MIPRCISSTFLLFIVAKKLCELFAPFKDYHYFCRIKPETQEPENIMHIAIAGNIGSGKTTLTNMIYYIYMNDDFTKMISDPKLLFEAPLNNNGVPAYNVIDSDIIKVGDTYHLFYVSHEHMATVKHATSTNVTSPFVIDDKYDDGGKHAAVAPFTVKEAKTLEKCWEKRKQ